MDEINNDSILQKPLHPLYQKWDENIKECFIGNAGIVTPKINHFFNQGKPFNEYLDNFMNETATITLSGGSYGKRSPMFNVGDIIKVKRRKRVRFIVTRWDEIDGYVNVQAYKAYKPSPKSKLNKKSVFSKFKTPICKH